MALFRIREIVLTFENLIVPLLQEAFLNNLVTEVEIAQRKMGNIEKRSRNHVECHSFRMKSSS